MIYSWYVCTGSVPRTKYVGRIPCILFRINGRQRISFCWFWKEATILHLFIQAGRRITTTKVIVCFVVGLLLVEVARIIIVLHCWKHNDILEDGLAPDRLVILWNHSRFRCQRPLLFYKSRQSRRHDFQGRHTTR